MTRAETEDEKDERAVRGAKPVVAFKGFDADFKCRGFQYEVGATYTHKGPVVICSSGFHGCENPLDLLNYYNICESRFGVVEQSGSIKRHDEDSKIASASITIKAELWLGTFIRDAVTWVIEHCKEKKGDSAKLAASGNYAKLAASGKDSVIASSANAVTAKGANGTWIALAEFKNGGCVGFATGCIGKCGLKADTYYCAKGGKLVKAS